MKLKALLVAGLVTGGVFAAAAPASAYCNPTLYKYTGSCSECSLAVKTAKAAGVDLGIQCFE